MTKIAEIVRSVRGTYKRQECLRYVLIRIAARFHIKIYLFDKYIFICQYAVHKLSLPVKLLRIGMRAGS